MLNLKYPILQSGFLGMSESGLTKQLPVPATFSDTILFRQRDLEFDNYFYSDDVTQLYVDWQANSWRMSNFEFRNQILGQALKRFGPSIIDWINFQGNKPGFSETHKQFIIKMSEWMTPDLIQPVMAGDALRWVGFLGPCQGNDINMPTGILPGYTGMGSTPTAIAHWVSKTGGYQSLLVALYVIFGKRVGHTQSFEM